MNPWDFDRGFWAWLANGDDVDPGDASDIWFLLLEVAMDDTMYFDDCFCDRLYPYWDLYFIRLGELTLDLSGNLDAPL